MCTLILFLIFSSLAACGGSRLPAARPQSTVQAAGDIDRGVELYRSGDYDQAVSVLERALVSNPNDVRALTYLGLAYALSQRPREALEPLRKALAADEANAEAHFGLGIAYGYLGRLDRAVAELSRAVELDPDHAYAHYHLGLAANQQGRVDLAVLHLSRFLELAPDAPEAPQVRVLLKKLRG